MGLVSTICGITPALHRDAAKTAAALLLLAHCTPNAHAEPIYRQIDHAGHIVEMQPNRFMDGYASLPGWRWAPDPFDRDSGVEILQHKLPDGRIILCPAVVETDSGRLIITDGKLQGISNLRGDLIVPPSYLSMPRFKDGMTFAQRKENAPWCLLDVDGKIKYTFPSHLIPRYRDHVSSPTTAVLYDTKTETHGIFNLTEQQFHPLSKVDSIADFYDGLAVFSVKEKFGYVDEHGKEIIPPTFPLARDFHEGLASVRLPDAQSSFAYIDKSGRVAITLPADCSFASDFSEGVAAIAVGADAASLKKGLPHRGGRWQFIDRAGKSAMPQTFPIFNVYDVPTFCEGLAPVANAKGLMGYIDHHGTFAIPPIYSEAFTFLRGKAMVRYGNYSFSKREWLKARDRDRGSQWDDFVHRFKLIGLPRARVHELLGKPDSQRAGKDRYIVIAGLLDGGVEITYSPTGIATAWKRYSDQPVTTAATKE